MPRATVRLSPSAEHWFLIYIAELAAQNPAAARKILARLAKLKEGLARFPEMTERGLIPGSRRIVMRPLILTARVRKGVVEIASIRHERQKDAQAPSDFKSGDET
ncbi:type II toxin-antitoxin system RelE/ParE family toxin [Neorhizobium galegae]|uniref:type II toxin-antitoxin system RelE/ParE family toxin n=1 Tax=Neorhizobium galegae TaxID=399 RepID=UPI00062130C8|nr:type II toxin-antitoxin system RelE/ParE family toxin [Neorhizobium galegae]KAB1126917.1 type II toxin-antitoxin system RelE/ParE family toxin [Neorhizobium galegae]MCQ1808601.1 type II toxin-antitoxin system RelE/ParE family toxin [Neorhizobium galegae]CDZ57184.1 Plasmid stabilization system protein [Neorhizobium galegae bv. orientalis]CDZ69097.1 Plasmid stabilization system protein [Neorhizobium galegae bv. orientalis]